MGCYPYIDRSIDFFGKEKAAAQFRRPEKFAWPLYLVGRNLWIPCFIGSVWGRKLVSRSSENSKIPTHARSKGPILGRLGDFPPPTRPGHKEVVNWANEVPGALRLVCNYLFQQEKRATGFQTWRITPINLLLPTGSKR